MKINWKTCGIIILCIIGICILKYPYIERESTNFIKQILVTWQGNQYVNLVWFLSFLVIIYHSTNPFCQKLEYFEMRFQNRKQYIKYLLKKEIISTIGITILTITLQIILLAIISHCQIKEIPWLFILHYIIEMISINLILIFLYLLLKNYIYTYLTIIGTLLILLSIHPNILLPFISLFYNIPVNPISIVLIPINLYGIYTIYLHYDIGGVKYEVRN